jgi:hypothetical protein
MWSGRGGQGDRSGTVEQPRLETDSCMACDALIRWTPAAVDEITCIRSPLASDFRALNFIPKVNAME